MEYNQCEIKEGIKLHTIKTDKFKTNLIAVFLTTKLERENVTKNALIPAILRRGSKTLKTQEEISKTLEEMYGASFDCGIDKTGDNQVIRFYIETVNDNYLPKKENNLEKSIQTLLEIVFNPYEENGKFKKEYINQEKENMKKRIESRKDNKARYSLDRCIEEMYKDKPYGLYKFGYSKDLEKIDEKNLYDYYKELINTCKIDIFVSGPIDENIIKTLKEDKILNSLNKRSAKYNKLELEQKKKIEKENVVTEKMEVTQGKLLVGLDVDINDNKSKVIAMVYNNILGGSANSKMFQNVREKAHLAYVANSMYYKYKGNIIINSGIEISNYEKALELIKKQIEDMKNGKFTKEEVENAKKGIISAIKTINDEQDSIIIYYFGQELTNTNVSIKQYMDEILSVNYEDVKTIAKKVYVNTIYFLRD